VEAFIPYVHRLQAKMPKAGQFEVIEERVEKVVSDLRPGEYDLALLLDLLGHLSAAESLQVLRKLEKLVRGIVIFSPLGKYKPPPDDQNALQHVKSYWKAGDFSKLGYAVTILEGHLNHTMPPADAAWAVKSIAAAK
ncbi:hypothetical protein HYR69_08030, partial [Candidatus Sumerlaeota bacterium]|nr:hypothetical protein [Candidatus Sumerlaeota bacterium]